MKITSAEIYPLSIPLIEPIKMSRENIVDAKTVLCCITDEHGRKGWGEASVAPLMTGETLDSLVGSIEYLIQGCMELDWKEPKDFTGLFNRVLYANASAKSCLEMALLDLYTQTLSVPLWQFLRSANNATKAELPTPIPLLRMLGGSLDKELNDAKVFSELGFRHWKIKIGSLSLDEDLHRVKVLSDALAGDVISVDANCALSLVDAIRFCESEEASKLTFAEQLVSTELSVGDFALLKNKSPIPICLDESIHGISEIKRFIDADVFGGASLKLTKTGGVIQALSCANFLHAGNFKLNLACKVAETSLSAAATASLGFALGAVDWGFSMSNQYLRFDICDEPLKARHGHLDVAQLASSGVGITPNLDRVKEVIAKGYAAIQC
ncbi:mandelate racemase/muconate lactonizing enzyme family protein [Polynucleobacter brandtiae]|uniref:L-alanine-DL-glutamate epimerase-like enolase superfamily enzyme n=1 Tax=Polynucleobacter brandtiae TaxID=1938816 RepID=A0A2M8VIS8_9BURK|nr:enolase C-terminal domain-like protein [Polynucleobacter brandtiae]PJI76760.1 L-alanine-DL-glutamate epimerase-like enolase superfamily enzyme [Polynucleobacter brandtiae]